MMTGRGHKAGRGSLALSGIREELRCRRAGPSCNRARQTSQDGHRTLDRHEFGLTSVSREPLAPGVHPGSKVNEVLRSYPRTDSVFLQAGRMFVDRPDSLYAQYPEQTVAEYADRNGVDVDSLLRRLNAEAEASAWEANRASWGTRRRRWAPEGAIGYTGAYVELEQSNVETEPVVARQLARGPY